jgi:hypothetical protein
MSLPVVLVVPISWLCRLPKKAVLRKGIEGCSCRKVFNYQYPKLVSAIDGLPGTEAKKYAFSYLPAVGFIG